MRKDYLTIKNNVAGEVYDTSTAMLTRIGNYINIRYKDVLRRSNYIAHNYDYSFSTVASQKDYPLNEDFGKPLAAFDSTNTTELAEIDSLETLYRNYPSSIATTGNPTHYIVFESAAYVQPTSASVVSVVSSSSSDTTQKVLIRGISNGAEITEQVTLTGTSTASSTAQFTQIKGLSKDGNTYGYVTVTAGSQTLAVMSPKVLVARYKIVRLWKTPSGVATINFPYLINPMPLIEDNDYPVIDIDDILEIGAKAMAHSYQRREATANKYESLYESMISTYIWDKVNRPNMVYQFQPQPYTRETT